MELQTMPLRFRVWDKDTNNWADSSVIFNDIKWVVTGNGMVEFVAHDPSLVISQDTGLKDKNGKSIYTGDTLTDGDVYYQVEYGGGECFVTDIISGEMITGLSDIHSTTEVVGSIWQTPELLEEKWKNNL